MEPLKDFLNSDATVEDLARAWASMDGKVEHFDAEKDKSASEVVDEKLTGHYLGYIAETEEILRRAAKYARKRDNPYA